MAQGCPNLAVNHDVQFLGQACILQLLLEIEMSDFLPFKNVIVNADKFNRERLKFRVSFEVIFPIFE